MEFLSFICSSKGIQFIVLNNRECKFDTYDFFDMYCHPPVWADSYSLSYSPCIDDVLRGARWLMKKVVVCSLDEVPAELPEVLNA